MSEEQPTTQLPAPPDLFNIPAVIVEQWTAIPQNERLNFPLTRLDIDHMLLGMLRTLDAQKTLERVIVEWSNGNLADANKHLAEFQRLNVDAQNNIRQLATAVMASALKDRPRG